MKRKILLLSSLTMIVFTAFNLNSLAQSGQKWSTGGNSISTGDYIGTTNMQPLLFKVNNALALYIKPDGNVFINSLTNFNNGLVTFDGSGKLTPLTYPNDATKVFLGDGTWGNVSFPHDFWQIHNQDIFTMTPGNIGIGTDQPLFKLDVEGDVRISENLFVGGGIIISEKVNASKEVQTELLKSTSIKVDSIIMDSTKAFYGYSKFEGDVKLKNKLEVVGNTVFNGETTVNGNFRTAGNITFGGNQTMGYIPASGGNPEIIYFATEPEIPTLNPCLPTPSSIFQKEGFFQAYGHNVDGNINTMSMGFNGTDAVLDIDNSTGINNVTTEPKLLINYFCGKNVSICAGNNGGNIQLSSTGKVGVGTDNPQTKLHVSGNETTGAVLRLQRVFSGQGVPTTTWDFEALSGKLFFKTPDYSPSVLTLTKTGKAGVGTDNPLANFHIKGITDGGLIPGGGGETGEEGTGGSSGLSSVLRIEDNVINSSNNRNIYWDYTVSGLQQKMLISNNVGGTTNYVMTFMENGNCGIGVNPPTVKLDIDGEVKIRTLNETGSGDYMLVTDGSGLLGRKSVSNLGSQIISSIGNQLIATMGDQIHDDLGDHTATKNIILGNHWLTNNSLTNPEGIYIDSDNKVGIGTNNPNSTLDINGDLSVKDLVRIKSSISTAHVSIGFSNFNDDFYMSNMPSNMLLCPAGNIGVGMVLGMEAGPTEKLEIGNGHNLSLRASSYGNTEDIGDIIFKKYNGTVKARIWSSNSVDKGLFLNGGGLNGSNPIADLTIDENGKIGIGTSSPNAQLQINPLTNGELSFAVRNITNDDYNVQIFGDGQIWARRVRVKLGSWSDFVFKTDYKLMPTNELKDFIDKHKHLPEIPSEAEVIANGIDVGDMNSLLLKKIEELTLYLLKQQEEIDLLKKQIIK